MLSPLLTKMDNYVQAKQILKNAQLIYSGEQIALAIDQLAQNINNMLGNVEYPVIVLPVMNGGLILSGQLITKLNFPIEIDFCHATRYRNETSGSELNWKVKPQNSLAQRTVLIIDDIFDEGHTLKSVIEFCESEQADRVYSAVLIEKDHPRAKASVECDFIGMQVEDKYVFGFGMDYKGYHRHLNAIYAVNDDPQDSIDE